MSVIFDPESFVLWQSVGIRMGESSSKEESCAWEKVILIMEIRQFVRSKVFKRVSISALRYQICFTDEALSVQGDVLW